MILKRSLRDNTAFWKSGVYLGSSFAPIFDSISDTANAYGEFKAEISELNHVRAPLALSYHPTLLSQLYGGELDSPL